MSEYIKEMWVVLDEVHVMLCLSGLIFSRGI